MVTKTCKETPKKIASHPTRLEDVNKVPLKRVVECYHDGEYGDAQLFAELFNGYCVYDHIEREWYIWQGHYWKKDDIKYIRHYISGILASAYIQASDELSLQLSAKQVFGVTIELNAQRLNDGPGKDEQEEERAKKFIKALQSRASSLKQLSREKNILTYAESFLAITSDKWDCNPWVLGTKFGVIDLRIGDIRDGKPEDYIRKACPTEWKGLNYECPTFERFLHEVLAGDNSQEGMRDGRNRSQQEVDDLFHFLQRALGYGMTGKVNEHIFLFLFGMFGRNGKDTLLTAIGTALGDVAGAVSNDVVISSKNASPGAAKPHLVALQGKRLAWASETDEGARFDASQVKMLTGGGSIPARQLYGKEYAFSPSHLLMLMTNFKPHANSSDEAFWARMCPIVFHLQYDENPVKSYQRKKDTSLEVALAAEASGILAWLVRGCLEWQKVGLSVPTCVMRERKKYQKEENTLHNFIEDVCNTSDPTYTVGAAALFEAYQQWCEKQSIRLGQGLTGVQFGKKMGQLFHKKPTRVGSQVINLYHGIGLQSEYGTPPTEDELLLDRVKNALSLYLNSESPVLEGGDGIQWSASGIIEELEKALQGSDSDKAWAKETIDSSLPVWEAYKKGS